MSLTSSEYDFPIFISSTDYNLIDLRAELAKYLSDLGYKPILSSADGFHDNSPNYAPWESCLQVLQSTYVMVLIIDNKYGEKFKWPNFQNIIGDTEVSPTHAEYLFAHKMKMRMLVFIRSEMLTHYQSYRNALKNAKDDKDKAKEALSKVLPKHIAFETLEFIAEVKTTPLIPWIKSFENVTDIKKEIQRKLLNELAELFLFKNKHIEAVVKQFSKVLYELSDDKRVEVLENIGVTKEFKAEIERQTKIIQELNTSKATIEKELNLKSSELEQAKTEKKNVKVKLENTITDLHGELKTIKNQIRLHENENANILVSGSSTMYQNPGYLTIPGYNTAASLNLNSYNPQYSSVDYISQSGGAYSIGASGTSVQSCDKCKQEITSYSMLAGKNLKECSDCNRNLCQTCFNGLGMISFDGTCIECKNKKAKTFFSIPPASPSL